MAACALTKAPESAANLVSNDPVTLNFSRLPVTAFVKLIANYGEEPATVTGLERLGDSKITLQVEAVPAREVLQRVLNCAGFAYEERAAELAIVPADERRGAACTGMTLE